MALKILRRGPHTLCVYGGVCGVSVLVCGGVSVLVCGGVSVWLVCGVCL